jgi:hypothetical protein
MAAASEDHKQGSSTISAVFRPDFSAISHLKQDLM